MQRLRIRFCRGQEVKFISHLDIMRGPKIEKIELTKESHAASTG